MDVQAARGNERMLRRLIALLVALAVLAERVADRSLAVRLFVLWILRRAETAAADFVFEEVGTPPLALQGFEGIASAGNESADALHLATRFKMLAALLCASLPLDCQFHRSPAPRGFASGRRAQQSGRRPDGWTRMPYDTS